MEVHSAPAVGKRMWSYLRAVFFMARKGLLSNKRKLLLGVHLLMKRRNRAVSCAVAGLLSHHHNHPSYYDGALRRREYEFSCSNSPAGGPDPSGGSSGSRRRPAAYLFPGCLGAEAEEEEYCYAASPAAPWPLARIEYSPAPSSPGLVLTRELAPGEEEEECGCPSPALPGAGSGGFSVRVSNYSSEDEGGLGGSEAVDDAAKEFIRRFYDQLRRQNTVTLLPYYMQMQESAA